ncbi:MAG: DUF2203 family protein [Thermoplasmata archaeon]
MPDRPRRVRRAAGTPRVWTVEEANERLDSLNELLVGLRAWAVRLRAILGELGRLRDFWGTEMGSPDHPDGRIHQRLEAERQRLTRSIESEVQSLFADGIEVKDLDIGLVDFYTRAFGDMSYLCWQRGETQVGFYHALTEGYRHRRPIPSPGDLPPTTTHHSA